MTCTICRQRTETGRLVAIAINGDPGDPFLACFPCRISLIRRRVRLVRPDGGPMVLAH